MSEAAGLESSNEVFRLSAARELLGLLHTNSFPWTHVHEIALPQPAYCPDFPEWTMMNDRASLHDKAQEVLADFSGVATYLGLMLHTPRAALSGFCQMALDDESFGEALIDKYGKRLTADNILPEQPVIKDMLRATKHYPFQSSPSLEEFIRRTSAPWQHQRDAFLAASALRESLSVSP